MDAELVVLAGSGATTLVGLMATDAWGKVKSVATRTFSRGVGQEALASDLEATRLEVLEAKASPNALESATRYWQTRLIELALSTSDPTKALTSLLDDMADVARSHSFVTDSVEMNAEASNGGKIAQQVHGIQIIN